MNEIPSINMLKEHHSLTTELEIKKWYKDKNSIKIIAMGFMIGLFAIVEFAFGIFTNSLALLADAFHMLSDVISLGIAFISIQMAKKTKTREYSYGWIRAETIGALVNGVFLLSVSFYILLESIQRFITPPIIQKPDIILIVGSGGLLVNLIGLIMFGGHGDGHSHGHSHSHNHGHKKKLEIPTSSPRVQRITSTVQDEIIDLQEIQTKKRSANIHGVFLHVLGDALGSISAMISGLGIWLLPFPQKIYLDPICSVLISMIILVVTVPLVKSCIKILMQSVPSEINLEEIEKDLLEIEGVVNIHEFHVWQLSNTKIIGTVHMNCSKSNEFYNIATKVKQILHKFGVHSTTIQPEFVDSPEEDKIDSCKLPCQSIRCDDKQCCSTSLSVKKRTQS